MNKALLSLLIILLPLTACTTTGNRDTSRVETEVQPLIVGAIPDQDPVKLQRLYGKLTDYLGAELGGSRSGVSPRIAQRDIDKQFHSVFIANKIQLY